MLRLVQYAAIAFLAAAEPQNDSAILDRAFVGRLGSDALAAVGVDYHPCRRPRET